MAKIVLAEDDQMLAEIYQTRLELDAQHTCKVAHDGMSALTLIHKEMPDLVLLDLMMPQLSGDQVLERMRETDWGKETKVIILTNMGEQEAPPIIKELDVKRFIVKADMTPRQVAEMVKAELAD